MLDLCGAYACIANEGRYLQPHFYTKVCNAEGEVLLDHTENAFRTILKPSTAYLLTDAMSALEALGEIDGLNVSQSVIDQIFESFCVGK